jgi:lipopolysaccharide biosynthesis glycosyltransferase
MDENSLEYNIVTSCTPQYLPGLVALKHSLDINFPSAKLTCFWYGQGKDDDFKLPEGIDYIKEAPMEGVIVDSGKSFRHNLKLGPDMYARLLIPRYFTGRAFYVDVDCLVLQDFSQLFEASMDNHRTACVYRPHIGWVGGHMHDDMASGTFMVDCDKWRYNNTTEEIFQIMRDYEAGKIPQKFNVNVESVMSYAHAGHFQYLPPEYQNLTYYGELTTRDIIAHFAGPKPWPIPEHAFDRNHVNYKDLWYAYYDKDIDKINKLTMALPQERSSDNPWDRRKQM